MKQFLLFFVRFYQRYISILKPQSCRYIPSCSHYAVTQLKYNNVFKAFYHIITRILTCNQMFDGGFDYPVIKLKGLTPSGQNGLKKFRYRNSIPTVRYWFVNVPSKTDTYYIIENWTNSKK
jgi:putative membrane protein insertion efficiency factor